MRTGVLVFPGSNCDRDVMIALRKSFNKTPLQIWHKETEIPNLDLIVIPGGFSFGDYLRCGAIAANSPIIKALKDHSSRGGAILGICNGFQILTESHLLPGSLLTNKNLKFICKEVKLITQKTLQNPFTSGLKPGLKIKLPIAHNEGNYFANNELLKNLEDNGQIAFKYLPSENPNGSKNDIAGILSKNGRVLGMMPHPERSINQFDNSNDGKKFFTSLLNQLLS